MTDVDSRPPRILSLCSGGAGLDLGLGLAMPGARTVCYVEREVFACAVLAARMQDGLLHQAPIWTDITTFDGGRWRGAVDIVTAGYPCQPFSLIGGMRGESDERHLWPHVRRIIDECRPQAVFCENVENHVKLGFETVSRELRGMGYQVEAGVFGADEVGAPHFRRRLFILGHAVGEPVWPGPVKEAGQEQAGGQGCGVGLGTFPPGPDDLDRWRSIVQEDGALKPGFRGLDDELASGVGAPAVADRMAQLRLLGNGVVPLVAAYAFCVLCHRLAGAGVMDTDSLQMS